jgi:hypothetical protein
MNIDMLSNDFKGMSAKQKALQRLPGALSGARLAVHEPFDHE